MKNILSATKWRSPGPNKLCMYLNDWGLHGQPICMAAVSLEIQSTRISCLSNIAMHVTQERQRAFPFLLIPLLCAATEQREMSKMRNGNGTQAEQLIGKHYHHHYHHTSVCNSMQHMTRQSLKIKTFTETLVWVRIFAAFDFAEACKSDTNWSEAGECWSLVAWSKLNSKPHCDAAMQEPFPLLLTRPVRSLLC